MNNRITDFEAGEIEKAITFLVENVNATSKNPKPVILHSIRVAIYLLDLEYSTDIVLSAILHDVLEDTDVSERRLNSEFGTRINNIVKAVSYNEKIENWTQKYQEVFDRVIQQGKAATILKCADIYQNSFYIQRVEDASFQKLLVDKIGYFLNLSKDVIGDEVVWKDLKRQFMAERGRIETIKA